MRWVASGDADNLLFFMSDEVKQFLSRIGRKGGKKSAQHPNRRKLNQKAAESRWRKRLPEPKAISK